MAMFIGPAAPVHPPISMTGQTMSEKILARASHAQSMRPGQIVDGEVHLLYMHEMLALALLPFNEIGTMKVWDPQKIVVTLDHWVPPPTPEDRKSTRLNSSHVRISYAVFCLKKKKNTA